MFKSKESKLQELSRRLLEATEVGKCDTTSQKSAENFFSRIADYTNFIFEDRLLHRYCDDLQNQVVKLPTNRKLVQDGNKIIKELKADFQITKDFFAAESFDIVPLEQVVTTTGSFGQKGWLTIEYHQLEGFLLPKAERTVWDLPPKLRSLCTIIYQSKDLGINNESLNKIAAKCEDVMTTYERELKEHETWMSYIRVDDLNYLRDVWRYYFDSQSLKSLTFRLKFGELLDKRVTFPHLDSEQLKILKEAKEEYLGSTTRLHNYLCDRLGETSLASRVLFWVWDNFGKTIVSLAILFLLRWLLIRLGWGDLLVFINHLLGV